MKIWVLGFLLILSCQIESQTVINKEYKVTGNITLTDDISIPKINPGYTVWLPDVQKIAGMIVFTHSRRDTLEKDNLINHALSRNLAVLYVTTENRLEFFFSDEKMQEIETYIQEVIKTHHIPGDRMLYCGMSLEGTRALKLASFGKSAKSKHQLIPKAIAICDAPLDMLRFHKEMVKAKELNFNPITANEGAWVSGYLERNLGGTPATHGQAYIDYSPYCYSADGGPNVTSFEDIPIRAYSEPDVNWWIETRRKDYYAMNVVDLAAIVNELKIRGNKNAELILSQDKGYHPDGQRHPHSWSIVDEQELIDWFIRLN